MNTENIKNYATLTLFNILLPKISYSDFLIKLVYNGFHFYNDGVYIFFDLTNLDIETNNIYKDSPNWFCLINEIINGTKVCELPISKIAYDFFTYNYNFCILTNEKDQIYELPVVGYVAKPESKLHFTYVFGETAEDKNSMMGPYFYFTSFTNSVKKAHDLKESVNKTGIVRFALFLGKLKYIENHSLDEIDSSATKKERLDDDNLDTQQERLTMRISDHDGIWTEEYDSVYLSPIELDDGSILKNTPIIVLKEYKQQIPLSYIML